MSNPGVIEVRDLEGNVVDKPELPELIHNRDLPFVSGFTGKRSEQ